jgi:hypothetical protein
VYGSGILLLKSTMHQLSLFDKMPQVHRFFHACLTFLFRLSTVTEGRFAKRTIKKLHTITIQIEVIRGHAFPNTYAETEILCW